MTPAPGSWVKLVKGDTVINGYVRSATSTHVTIKGLRPIPIEGWNYVIIKNPKDTLQNT